MTTVILRTTARLLVPLMAIASVHLLLRGHDAPGGGFIGGLVAGAGMVLHRSTRRPSGRRQMHGPAIVAVGWTVVVLGALLGFVIGGTLLAGTSGKLGIGPFEVKLTSSLLFDAGVFAIVLGVVTTLIEALGEDAW